MKGQGLETVIDRVKAMESLEGPDPQPNYGCPDCQDTGWITVVRGGLSGAKPCGCVKERELAGLLDRAEIPECYFDSDLLNFETGDPGLERMLSQAKTYAANFTPASRGMLITGYPGTGKTHLAVGIIKVLIARGFACRFVYCQNLLEKMKASYTPDNPDGDAELYWRIIEEPVLLLDDIGSSRITEWTQDTMCQILTHRCNAKLPTIMTTNVPDERQLVGGSAPLGIKQATLREVIGDRARSRLFEMCQWLTMPAVPDFRMKRSK